MVLTAADIGISDPDGTNFTFTVLSVTHGQFEIFANGSWTSTATFTSADIAAGHVRFTHDGGEVAPTFSIQANDGFVASSGFTGTINFSPVNDRSGCVRGQELGAGGPARHGRRQCDPGCEPHARQHGGQSAERRVCGRSGHGCG